VNVQRILWAVLATACGTPTETGPRGLVGRILDPAGVGVPGVEVTTVEAGDTTDMEGRFAVAWKDPNLDARFTYDGVTWIRNWQPDVDPASVDIVMRPLKTLTWQCQGQTACDATLTWDLGDGLRAEIRTPCDPEQRTQTFRGPDAGPPTRATCRTGTANPDLTLAVGPGKAPTLGAPPTDFRATPPRVDLTVKIANTSSETEPVACEVLIDRQSATPIGNGAWSLPVWGKVQIVGQCDGIPFSPKGAYVVGPGEVTVPWSPTIPFLDLHTDLPDLRRVRLRAIAGGSSGWELELVPHADGKIPMPPLPPGTYVFGFDVTAAQFDAVRPAKEGIVPNVLQIAELPTQGEGARNAFIGLLALGAPLVQGQPKVSFIRLPADDPASEAAKARAPKGAAATP
jgi:hypothetical protein